MKKLFWSAQLSEYYTAVLNNEAMAVDSLVQDLDKFPLIFATLVRWCSTGFFSAAQQQACCKLCSSGSLQVESGHEDDDDEGYLTGISLKLRS